jgi:hypothetical protein
MRKLFKHRPSPAMVVAVIALIMGLGGSAYALNKKDKKQVRNIANGEITKRASGLSVAKAGDSDKLAGVAASGYTQGGGHNYFGTKSASSNTLNNALLSIPGFADLSFNCAANGVDSTLHITNTSGASLGDVGQNQTITQANLEPFGPAIAPGGTVNIIHTNGGTGAVADTTMNLWVAATGKVARVNVSNVFCDYSATATTN